MKIKLKETPDQIELIRAMASKNRITALEAREAFAALLQPVANQVLNQAGTTAQIYRPSPYDEDDSPSIPLDIFYATESNFIQVWTSGGVAGGIPTNQFTGLQELKISTFKLESAISWLERYAKRARVDVVSAGLSRLMSEVVTKKNRNGWSVLMKALAEASTNGSDHLITSTTQNVLQLDDFNRLLTLSARINESYDGGTSDENAVTLTDIYLSPEMMEEIRSMAYEPQNTTATPNTDESTAVPLPDNMREQIYRSAGASEIYGITIHQLKELGVGEKYTHLFDSWTTGNIAHSTQAFDATDDEIIVGIDLSRENSCIMPIARNAENGENFVLQPDDQWTARSSKFGFWGACELGFVVVDARALAGIVV